MKNHVWAFLLLCLFTSCQTSSRIAYLTNRSGNFDIYITDEQGENHLALTDNPGWDWYPKWNKALKGIIYNANDTLKNFRISMMDDQGNSMALDTDGLESFILAPNGKMALYTESDSNFSYINAFNVLTRERTPLVTTKAYNGRAMWAPNGKMFSFITDRDGNNEIYIFDLTKGVEVRLTNTASREKYTSWTPDSRSIVFTSSEEDQEYNDIYRVDITSGNINRITNDEKLYEEISVSPDGKKIAFHAQRNGQHHIFRMHIDGSGEKQLTSVKAYHGEPEWIPGKN